MSVRTIDDNSSASKISDPQNTKRLLISDMSCASCVETVESGLRSVHGVSEATVNFADRSATVTGDASEENGILKLRSSAIYSELR